MKTAQTTTTDQTQTTTTGTNTFVNLLRAYEQQASTGRTSQTETAYTNALTDLATAVAYSVLKKCIDVSQNNALKQVRQSIARDTHTLQNITYASDNAYTTTYNAEGDRVQTVADKDLSNALDKLCAETLGDGIDLVNDAVIAILQETEKAKERNSGTLTPQFMEAPYTVRRLKRKVWIKLEDSVNGWETVETKPIQEVYKAVRRAIDSSRAAQTDPRNGYLYIEDFATDTESESVETVYRRLPKYADIGGAVTDFNGKETVYTADDETVTDIDKLVEMLNLSARQAKVLQLRQSGHGYKAIATYLGVDHSNAVRVCRQIQAKIKTNTPELYALAVKKGYTTE